MIDSVLFYKQGYVMKRDYNLFIRQNSMLLQRGNLNVVEFSSGFNYCFSIHKPLISLVTSSTPSL